ncbi:MAG TPA: glycosyltransferase [Rhodothermales bacterium]
MHPRVSVIMPFVAEEGFLSEAIESVRNQEFGEWELLLVDDGAADVSRRIAERFVAADPRRIRLLDPDSERRGAAAARNRALAQARGEFLAFLDADDAFRPRKLAREVAALDAHTEAAMLYARTRWWYQGIRGHDWTERLGVAPDRLYAPPYLFTRILLEKKGDIPCTCGVLLRKGVVMDEGGFEERFALYEDQSLWAKLFLSHSVFVSNACHALYRQHPGSTSATAQSRGDYDNYGAHRAQDAFFRWLAALVTERNAAPEVLQAVYQAKVKSRRVPGRMRRLLLRALRHARAS